MFEFYLGPVIPRSPPDSAFTRRRAQPKKETGRSERAIHKHCQHQQIPDPSVLEHFYVISSSNQSKGTSHTGANEVYAPLKTPFDRRGVEELLKKPGMQFQQPKSGGSDDVCGVNTGSDNQTSQDSHMSFNNRPVRDEAPISDSGERVSTLRSSNNFSCSIESLDSQCKAAIMEEHRIRQMEKSGGYSMQDFHHSFEGSVLGQMKRRASQSPQRAESNHMITSETQVQVHQGVQQTIPVQQHGRISYGLVLVPFASEQTQESNKPANI